MNARLRLGYARHWLCFKVRMLFKPYTLVTPASPARWRLERTRYGFILWGRRKRRHLSWRFWCEGPCNLATYAWLRAQ
jgi:hypothetical protein